MQKKSSYLFGLLFICHAIACNTQTENQNTTSHDNSGPPYTVKVEEYFNKDLPDLHSYTHATYKDKIIMMGGRTNGLHGESYEFSRENSNKSIYVIDTKDWSEPDQWKVSSMPANKVVVADVNTDQFIANNAQFFTRDSVLYIVGGLLGANVATKLKNPGDVKSGVVLTNNAKSVDGATPSGPITLPYFTAVNLPALINLVLRKEAVLPAHAIRQVVDSSMQVTGGEVSVMNHKVYLVFGWNFHLNNGDLYTHQIRTFSYQDDGVKLSISGVSVCKSCWDGMADTSLLGNFRRRDGSMSAVIDPQDGSEALMYYAGVFKDGNTNFDSPVWIGKDAATEQSFVMRSNVYTCQVIPVYSASHKKYYATLLGGMKNANYNGKVFEEPIELTERNAPLIAVDTANPFDHIPFSNQFSTVVVDRKHQISQYLLADSFPRTKQSYILPAAPKDSIGKVVLPAGSVAFNGAESEMIWVEGSPRFPNGVIDYDTFIKANPEGATIAYLHGGILSSLINVFGTKAAHFSIASNRIFAVKIVPLKK